MIRELRSRFFDVVVNHFQSRGADLVRLIETGYSFEEWFNWEVFVAAAGAGFRDVSPRPAYRLCSPCTRNLFGDLLVTEDGAQLLLEVGLVHDRTGDKWLTKLEGDRSKLSRLMNSRVAAVQLIACGSARDVRTDREWVRWVNRLSMWTCPSFADHTLVLGAGTLRLRAWDWSITPDAATSNRNENTTEEAP